MRRYIEKKKKTNLRVRRAKTPFREEIKNNNYVIIRDVLRKTNNISLAGNYREEANARASERASALYRNRTLFEKVIFFFIRSAGTATHTRHVQ